MSSNYYIKIICLENCSYSISAVNLLKSLNISHKITYVDYNSKELYKNNLISTYPQIFLKKNNSKGNLFLGGYDDLVYSINTLKYDNLNKLKIKEFINKYKWSRKSVLRFIQLLN